MGSPTGFNAGLEFDEILTPVDRGSGTISAATRQANALVNLGFPSGTVLTGVVAGTVSASKAVVVDANKDITGYRNITMTGLLAESAGDTLTALGGGQAGALALTKEVNRFTTVGAGNGGSLPLAVAGLTVLIINSGANALQVFGAGTDIIDDVATATGVSQMVGSVTLYTCTTTAPAGKWYSEGLGTGWAGSLQTISFSNTLTAAGTTQATGLQLTTAINRVTVGAATTGVNLPAAAPGLAVTVINAVANSVHVYPVIGGAETINGVAAATGVVQMSNSVVTYYALSTSVWVAIGLGSGFAGSLTTNAFNAAVVAHAGGTQAAAQADPAALLTGQVNNVTTCVTAGDSVALPAAVPGLEILVRNSGATTMQVFGAGTDTINSIATATGAPQDPATWVEYICTTTGNWLSMPDASKPALQTTGALVGATFPAGAITGAGFITYVNTAATPGTLTTRTATQMFNDTHNAQVGQTFMVMIIHSGAGTMAIGAGAGVTLSALNAGVTTIATLTWRLFAMKFTAATTLTMTSVATGTWS